MENNQMVEKLKGNLGIDVKELEMETLREKIERRRNEYISADDLNRGMMFSELNYQEATLAAKVSDLLDNIPSLARMVHDIEKQSQNISVATMDYFKSFFVDFDSSAANSIGQLVSRAINSVKLGEGAAYREGSYAHVLNIVMSFIEDQGAKGRRKSKSKFIRGLYRKPEQLEQFKGLMEYYVRFQWELNMMTEGTYSNSLLDDAKEDVRTTLNNDVIEKIGSGIR